MFRSALVVSVALALPALSPAGTEAASGAKGTAALAPHHHAQAASPRKLHAACPMPLLICSVDPLVDAGKKVGGAAVGVVGGAAGDVAAGAANTGMSGVVSWAADGAAWLVREVARHVERSSRPALGSAWFTRRYAGMAELAIALVSVFLLLAVGQAIATQDLGRLIRAVFVCLPVALLLTFAAVTLVQLGLAVTDSMTAAAMSGMGGDVRRAFRGLGDLLSNPASPGLAPFVLFLTAVVTALLALMVWLELVMREAAVYVAVAFLPLTLAGLVWERTAHWSRRLTEWLFAIVLAKFTIGASFAIAASAIVGAPKDGGGLTALLAGCAVLALAALTPFTLLKLLPFAEAAAGRTLTRGHVGNAAGAVPGATTATIAARQLVLKNFAPPGAAVPGARAATPRTPGAGRPNAGTTRPPGLPRANPPRRPAAGPRNDT